MILCAPEVASIWGLACKGSGDFSSLIPPGGIKLVTRHPLVPCGTDPQCPPSGSTSVGPGYTAKLLSHEF